MFGRATRETKSGGNSTASTVGYALADTCLISQYRDGTTGYYLPDSQGSTRLLTNAAGNITDTYSYTAFGELYAHTGATANPYLYTGQHYDALTDLYHLRARYYDSAIGRFFSRDPYPVNTQDPFELNLCRPNCTSVRI